MQPNVPCEDVPLANSQCRRSTVQVGTNRVVASSGVVSVIYRWRVEDGRQEEFVRWWHEGTLRIRARHGGALGSTLCEPTAPREHFVGIARWRSQADLELFWQNPGGLAFQGAVMESAEILEEVDHLTAEGEW